MTIHADFASQEYFRNPAAGIANLRAAGPVVEVRFPIVGKVWTTTTQALADQVLKDSGTFTVRKDDGTVAGMQWWMPGIVRTLANSMLSMDDPDHRRLRDIVEYTVHWGPYTGPIPLILLTPVGFVIYIMAAVAETNRAPFDLPEAEQELIGGFLTEYSGLKFVMYYLAEYINMITVSALAALLFFGGWYLWFVPPVLAFVAKVIFFLFLYIWLRGTLPRLRYDMLMRLGWKVLMPLAIANIIVTGIVLVAVQG